MTCKVIDDKNKPIKILDCGTNNVFSLENKEEALKFCDALNVTLNYVNELIDAKVELKKENELLKSKLSRCKEVNRLDIWEYALITELQDKCDKKQEHIIHLENKIHRMRKQIKKLEELYHYRSVDLKRENEQLKQRINSRLHFYRELYDSTKDSIVKRVVEDLEDILKR